MDLKNFRKKIRNNKRFKEIVNNNEDYAISATDFKKRIRKQIRVDYVNICIAVGSDCYDMIRNEYADWLDNQGHAEYYILVEQVVYEAMLTPNSLYLKMLAKHGFNINWHEHSGTHDCFDWHFMEVCKNIIRKELNYNNSLK